MDDDVMKGMVLCDIDNTLLQSKKKTIITCRSIYTRVLKMIYNINASMFDITPDGFNRCYYYS